MQTIGIYCSASTHIDQIYNESAGELAKWIGSNGMTVVNGGSNQGLMAIFSNVAIEHGGKCIGVVPSSFKEKGWFNSNNNETIFVENLSERKEVIKKISDILLVFPGGVGSLDELFDAWASYNLDFHSKKIILVNINGFYEPLINFIETLKKERFMHEFLPNPVFVADSIEDCKKIIQFSSVNDSDLKSSGYRIY